MNPSSTLCRAQEAHHRERAAATQLENVRLVAANAAIAWAREARAAERREERGRRTRSAARLETLRKEAARDELDRLAGETPDRGFESP